MTAAKNEPEEESCVEHKSDQEGQREISVLYCDDRERLFMSREKPSKDEIEEHWKELPIKFDESFFPTGYIAEIGPENRKKHMMEVCERIFRYLNREKDNPLSSERGQRWIKTNMEHGHTSMSVSDIVRIGDEYWFCASLGFEKLEVE